MKLTSLLFLAATSLVPITVAANNYPTRPITLVVPSAPGGSTDITARLIAEPLARALGQPVVIENKPGASGNLGTQQVAKASPDGYTLLMQYSGYHVANPALYRQLQWDPVRDFAPVAMAMRAPHALAVSGKLPVNSVAELAALGRKNAKGLFYASSGSGSVQHIAGVMLAEQLKFPLTHVPYKGAGPAVTDLIGGQVDVFVTTPPSVIGHAASGKIKLLAYTAPKRHPALANVPTSAEAGLPGYLVESWFAVFAPAKTPPEIINRLTTEIKKIVESDTYRKRMDEQGAFAAYMDPKSLGQLVSTDLEQWSKVIKAENITGE